MLLFLSLPFERMGESDVREEVLAPLSRALGYRTGGEHDVIRELSLRYPKFFLGRNSPAKDPDTSLRSVLSTSLFPMATSFASTKHRQ